jgi:hypothetical protein
MELNDQHARAEVIARLLTNPAVPAKGCFLAIQALMGIVLGHDEVDSSDRRFLMAALAKLAASEDAQRAQEGIRHLAYLVNEGAGLELDTLSSTERERLSHNYRMAVDKGVSASSDCLEKQLGLRQGPSN